jgi:hypothetical protein
MRVALPRLDIKWSNGVVVRPLGFEPRIAYAPGMYPEPC